MANVIHFHVPAEVVHDPDAKPVVSGGYPAHIPPDIAEKMGFKPSAGAGKAYVVLCNPKIALDANHGATDAPWAVTCKDCIDNRYWEEQIKLRPHPKANAQVNTIKECC